MASLSSMLRECTKEAHDVVQRSEAVDALITGLLPRDLHIQYLVCLHRVYATLESHLQTHAAHPVLCYNYDPLIFRATNLDQDICYFLDLPQGSDWSSHPLVQDLAPEVQVALNEYTARLDALSASSPVTSDDASHFIYPRNAADPYLLLAHSYVRYMGDLSGGQAVRKVVAAAYALPLDSLDGQRFYHFGQESTIHELKAFKARFRHGLDMAGAELTEAQKTAMLQESNHAFELNIRLFSSFSKAWKRDEPEAQVPDTDASSASLLSDVSSDISLSDIADMESTLPVKSDLWLRVALSVLVLLLAVYYGSRSAHHLASTVHPLSNPL